MGSLLGPLPKVYGTGILLENFEGATVLGEFRWGGRGRVRRLAEVRYVLIGLLEVAVKLMRAMPKNMSINTRRSNRRARHEESNTPHAPPAPQSLIQGAMTPG